MKHALLSYLTAPLALPADYSGQFSNQGIARTIPEALALLGYEVDVVEWDDTTVARSRDYDLFVGHGAYNWEHLLRNVVGPDVPRLYFSTGVYWRTSNAAHEARHRALDARRGVRFPRFRQIERSEDVPYLTADGVVALGSERILADMGWLPNVVRVDNAVYPDAAPASGAGDRRRFLFLAGSGNVHKGLDLVLEAFQGLDAELVVATAVEPAFAREYAAELAAPNVGVAGWIDLADPATRALVASCGSVIFPSCAEGQPGSVLEAMKHGLVPIVSAESNVDVSDCGIVLPDCEIATIRATVEAVAAGSEAEHRERSAATRAVVAERHTPDRFRASFAAAVEQLLAEAPAVRASVGTRDDLAGALARGDWARALVLDASCVQAHVELALDEEAAGNRAGALALLGQAQRLCPNDEQIRGALAALSPRPRIEVREEQPLVSAIVSTYAAERFIRGCLEDLEAQTIADRLEIVVVDSASPENEGAVVREFQQRHGNIVYLRTDERESLYAAWNRGIRAARGTYVTNANTDDRHRADGIERLVRALDERPDAALAYADCAVTREENATLPSAPLMGRFRWPTFDPFGLFRVSCVGPQPVWRRSLHETYGWFDPELRIAGDYDWWLRLARSESLVHVPEVLGLYLWSDTSIEHRDPELCRRETELVRRRWWPAAWGALPPYGGSYFVEGTPTAAGPYHLQGRPVRILALAGELEARPELLEAYRQAVSAADPVTLVVYGRNRTADEVVAAMTGLGLDAPTEPDALVVVGRGDPVEERAIAARVDGILSASPADAPFELLARFDDRNAAAIATLVDGAEISAAA